MSMREALHLVVPQIVLLGGAVATLLVALLAPRRRQWANAPVALLAVGAAGMAQVDLARRPPTPTFEGIWMADAAGSAATLVVLAATALVIGLLPRWFETDPRHGEYYPIVLLGALGASALAGTGDLNLLVVAMLLTSVTGYVLAAYHRGSPLAVEAGMKFFLIGAFANLVLLVGVVLAFVAGGTTSYVVLAPGWQPDAWLLVPMAAAVVVGLTFEAGAVPAFGWMPDVAQGSPAPSAAFLTVVPKVGALVALARFVALVPVDTSGWRPMVAFLAVATMTLGNLAALRQDDVRRLLGWSSVSQSGYALIAVAAVGSSPLAVPALLLFLAGYAAANVAAFAVVVALRGRTRIEDYRGLGSKVPGLATVLVLALLSLVGIPPLGGFAGKFAVFTAAIDAGLGWLALVGVLNTVLSLAYYLRVIGPVVLGARQDRVHVLGPWSQASAAVAAIAVLAVGLGAEAFLHGGSGPLLP